MDESGVLLTPLARRSWAPRGQTPVLVQSMGRRQKVSVAAALWLSPHQDRLGWFFETLVDDYYNNERVAAFVEALLAEVEQRVVLVWDGGSMHKGEFIRRLAVAHASQLSLEPLPPYAPQLNPVESGWSWLKYGRLCNFAPSNTQHLHTEVLREMKQARNNQKLLRGFWEASELPLPRALLT